MSKESRTYPVESIKESPRGLQKYCKLGVNRCRHWTRNYVGHNYRKERDKVKRKGDDH